MNFTLLKILLLCAIFQIACARYISNSFYVLKKLSDSDEAKTAFNVGMKYAPPTVKVGFAAAKAVYKTAETLKETGDLSKAVSAGADSGRDSIQDITKTLPGAGLAKMGAGLAKDMYEGKDLKSAMIERGTDAANQNGMLGKVALAAFNSVHNGESLQDAFTKMGKDAVKDYAANSIGEIQNVVGENEALLENIPDLVSVDGDEHEEKGSEGNLGKKSKWNLVRKNVLGKTKQLV